MMIEVKVNGKVYKVSSLEQAVYMILKEGKKTGVM